MNTEEAIEFMEGGKKYRIHNDGEEFPNTNKVIDLLKRGEKLESIVNHNKIRNKVLEARIKGLKDILKKYEKMWDKMYKNWGEYPIELHDIAEFMDDIKQEYFPK